MASDSFAKSVVQFSFSMTGTTTTIVAKLLAHTQISVYLTSARINRVVPMVIAPAARIRDTMPHAFRVRAPLPGIPPESSIGGGDAAGGAFATRDVDIFTPSTCLTEGR